MKTKSGVLHLTKNEKKSLIYLMTLVDAEIFFTKRGKLDTKKIDKVDKAFDVINGILKITNL